MCGHIVCRSHPNFVDALNGVLKNTQNGGYGRGCFYLFDEINFMLSRDNDNAKGLIDASLRAICSSYSGLIGTTFKKSEAVFSILTLTL